MHEPVKQDELMQCLAAVGAGERAIADDDYNDGFVLPCAIDYQTVISCAPRDDRKVRVMAAGS